MDFLILVLPIVLAPAAIALMIGLKFRRLAKGVIFWIAALLLPGAAFIGGSSLMIYFLNMTPSSNNGGDGPAFFGIIFITFFLPPLLLMPGAVSGLLVFVILKIARRRFED